ncbi:eukaryotic translation initiation factor 3 subunit [Achlya hypogyna]|uniref:Eukaryotic translation initiation factor 3 subunit I n=1 Tax=Achlya hypogyna TaxID=1202772 RepID=A0A1V9ZDM9_ACHHY|nr:eukaryotic translation initiation factor 3 subunit [Achlya hypogyna]
MHPILLKGHSRSITMIKHNREGDLLVTVAKDHVPSLWYSATGERIGTFHGHQGAVWACDISYHSEYLLTAAADASVKLWDLKTGKEIFSFKHTGSARSVNFAHGDKQFVSVSDQFAENPATVFVYDLAQEGEKQSNQPKLAITKHGHKGRVTGAYWMPLNEAILTTGEDGVVKLFNPETGALISEHKIHNGSITNLSFNKDKTLAITSSKDNTAKLIDVETMEVLKTYETDRPVNSASISPTKEHVVLGGGQEAMSVTVTAGRAGKFEARFFHQVYEEEFARVKGHFGPINSITFHPDGKSYTSGAEDGYVRIHHFDQEYLDRDA